MTGYATVFERYEATRPSKHDWLRRHYIAAMGLRPGTLLDVGCGTGFWSDLFRREGFEVTAFDIDPAFVADGRAKYPAVQFAVADAEEPLGLGQFDVVFARTIPQFYAATLDRAAIVVANLRRHVGQVLLLSAYSDGTGRTVQGAYGGPLTYHPHDLYPALVEEAGGTVLRVERVGNYIQVLGR